jgi:hypothetical protein
MADPMTGSNTRCPWCSAALPAPDLEHCPSCGAVLATATGTEPDIRGVTTLDPEAILRARSEASRPRSRILSFITGEEPVETDEKEAASFAPPSVEVRREMLRLQLEAERADLEAESIALKADVVVEHGISLAEMAAEDAGDDAADGASGDGSAAGGEEPPAGS